jgi:hypothetical protein
MTKLLETELTTYETNRDELIGKADGKYVLIKGEKIAGIFDTESDATRFGYNEFGNVPFLVKQIVLVEVPVYFTSNLIRL